MFVAILAYDEAGIDDALARGASVNGSALNGLTMLGAAVTVMPKVNARQSSALRAPSHRILGKLLSLGANVNASDAYGMSALHLAAKVNADPKGIQPVLKAGADVDARDSDGQRPIDVAKHEGSKGMARALIEAGADTSGLPHDWVKQIRLRRPGRER
jgi:hypothetical protein